MYTLDRDEVIKLKIKIDNLGRIVIPKTYRKALSIESHDELEITLSHKTISITKPDRFCILCGSKDLRPDIPLCHDCIKKIKNDY